MTRILPRISLLRRKTPKRSPDIGLLSAHMRADIGLPPLDEIRLPPAAWY